MSPKSKFDKKQYNQIRRKEKLALYAVVLLISLWAMIAA
jgi:hypothetical protein